MATSDGMKLKMEGIEALTKALEALGTKVAARGPDAGVRAAGAIIIKEMRRRAPKDTGVLKKSIGQKVKKYRRNQTVTSIIGGRSKAYETAEGKRNPAFYAHLVELGTKPHRVGDGVHPGSPAQPFMRPAWDASAPAARQAVVTKMTEVFEKAAKESAAR
jgi:HK97 gp10 family phage protein